MTPRVPTRRMVLGAPAVVVAGANPLVGPETLLRGELPGAPIASCGELAALQAKVMKSGIRENPAKTTAEIAAALRLRRDIEEGIWAENLAGQDAALLNLVLATVGVPAAWTHVFVATFGASIPPFTVQALRFPAPRASQTTCVTVAGMSRVALLTVTDFESGQGGIHDCAQIVVLRVVASLGRKDAKEKAADLRGAVRAAGRLEAALAPALAGPAAARRHFHDEAARQVWLPDHLSRTYHHDNCKPKHIRSEQR